MFVLLVCMSSAYAADTSNSTNTTSNDTYDQILNDSAISTSLNNVKFDPDQVRSSVKFDLEQVKNTIPMKNYRSAYFTDFSKYNQFNRWFYD
jgi:hypothetical protein